MAGTHGLRLRAEEIQYVLGCSSIQISSPLDLTGVHAYLAASGALSKELAAEPLKTYAMPELDRIVALATTADLATIESGKERLPSLVATYLKVGAKLYGMPAYDRHFSCADYLSVLDVTRMTPAFQRRYGRSSHPQMSVRWAIRLASFFYGTRRLGDCLTGPSRVPAALRGPTQTQPDCRAHCARRTWDIGKKTGIVSNSTPRLGAHVQPHLLRRCLGLRVALSDSICDFKRSHVTSNT